MIILKIKFVYKFADSYKLYHAIFIQFDTTLKLTNPKVN